MDVKNLSKIKDVVNYCPESGIFTWKKKINSRCSGVGGRVGTLNKSGYLTVKIYKETYYLHRLAWLIYYGEIPVHGIDHRNGIKSDNRILNLRDIPQWANMQNTRKPRSSCGLLGASKYRGKFKAEIRVSGTKKLLGVFNTPEEAHIVYMAKKIQVHKFFYPD